MIITVVLTTIIAPLLLLFALFFKYLVREETVALFKQTQFIPCIHTKNNCINNKCACKKGNRTPKLELRIKNALYVINCKSCILKKEDTKNGC